MCVCAALYRWAPGTSFVKGNARCDYVTIQKLKYDLSNGGAEQSGEQGTEKEK